MRKAGSRIVAGIGVIVLVMLGWCCVPPQPFPDTKQPREGEAIHSKVAVVFSYHYQMNMGGLERLHPSPQKWGRIYTDLQQKGYLRPEDVFVPEEITREQILLVHNEQFLENLKDSAKVARYLEIPILAPFPNALVDAGVLAPFRRQTGGTLLAARLALKYGIGVNLGGGFHHAKPSRGEGFNIYADMAIAIRVLQKEGRIQRALVIDLDVHQGNGTAEIFAGDENVYTFSMQQGNIYPIPKARSDWDINLLPGTTDRVYLRKLQQALPILFRNAKPDIVFLQGGADVLAGDPLANLQLTPDGLVQRDAMVIDACRQRNIPVVTTIGGGYRPNAWPAQSASIARTIQTYSSLNSAPPHTPRKPTIKENLYSR